MTITASALKVSSVVDLKIIGLSEHDVISMEFIWTLNLMRFWDNTGRAIYCTIESYDESMKALSPYSLAKMLLERYR